MEKKSAFFTPGPWQEEVRQDEVVLKTDDVHIATVHLYGGKEERANARLLKVATRMYDLLVQEVTNSDDRWDTEVRTLLDYIVTEDGP